MRALALTTTLFLLAACGGSGGIDDFPERPGEHGLAVGGPGGGDIYSALPAPSAVLLQEISTPAMRAPSRIAVSRSGRIVVTDPRAMLVHVLSPHGDPELTIGVAVPLGVAVDGTDQIFVGDQSTGSVMIFDMRGTFLGMLGAGNGEFNMPNEIAWDPTYNAVHVVDSRANVVRVYDTSGAFLFQYGGTGSNDGEFYFPTGLVFDGPHQRAFVADHTNARVQMFDCTGGFINAFGSYGSGPAQYTRPQGLAIDDLDRLYVADAFQGQIQVVDSSGLHVGYVGQAGRMYGQLTLTTDLVLDPFNRLLVTSYGTGKIVVFGIDNFRDPPTSVPSIPANVVVAPSSINVLSRGRWVTAYIEVPDASAADLVVASIAVAGVAADLDGPASLGDFDSDGIEDLAVKLPRAELVAALGSLGAHAADFAAELADGRPVEGETTVVVTGTPR